MHRQTRCIVAWDVVRERTYATLQPIVDAVFRQVPHVQHFYSDGLATYQELVYRAGRRQAQHQANQDKSQTYTVEGTNADLRCYVPPLARRSRCFARCPDCLSRWLRLFVTVYNRCCLFRRRYPQRVVYPADFLPTLF